MWASQSITFWRSSRSNPVITDMTTIRTVTPNITPTIEIKVMIETKVRFGLRYRRARKKLNGSFKALLLHRVRLQIFEVHEFQDGRMRRLEINRRGPAMIERVLPPRNANAPAISWFQPGEAPLRHWGHEIVPIQHGEIEKLLGNFNANRVESKVFGAGPAVAVPVKSSHRFATTAPE